MSGLPPVRVAHPHVELKPDDGAPFVRGTRVAVRRLYAWHKGGSSVETLLKRYPMLGPARLFDALAFAYDNLELVEADVARERSAIAEADLDNPPKPAKQEKLPF
jgi:uncharacterized protein (DUF433 family)